MSLPPELRVLCFQLSSTPAPELPRLLPTLLRHVLRCQIALSSSSGSTGKADASATSVLIHKLKTQLSSLLNGRSPEGRFAAVVLIKAVVEVGGWEVLQGAELWVRGLLSILGKPDPVSTKEICIITLTKIYCMTHAYQTLIREITTPTLPTFITSCLNLVSKPSLTSQGATSTLTEVVFQSFALLLPRHTTIYRPFVSQIRLASRFLLAPTSFDGAFVSSSVKSSARHLNVILHLTAPKNTGGEEWAKAVRELIRDIHGTADLVFRAVIEDWESTAGYNPEPVDVNRELQGGGKSADDLPVWTGIYAGTERLAGLLEFLADHFKSETSAPVAIPLGAIFDMVTRMLSIPIPSSDTQSGMGAARLHPAVDRDEKDGLWAGLPQVYVSALTLVDSISERLQENFMSLAQGSFDQLAWVFPYGKHSSDFRQIAYRNVAKILKLIGPSFDRSSGLKLSMVVKACCHDLHSELNLTPAKLNAAGSTKKLGQGNGSNHNADTYLRSIGDAPVSTSTQDLVLAAAAEELLPLFMSHVPQQHLDISLRSLIERTAILSHNKDAMLTSILNPFVGKNGRALATILPHLARDFADSNVVEILLRPRMPLVYSKGTSLTPTDLVDEASEDEDMQIHSEAVPSRHEPESVPEHTGTTVESHAGLGPSLSIPGHIFEASPEVPTSKYVGASTVGESTSGLLPSQPQHLDVSMEDDDSSDNESVHLTMQLDTDSESD